MTGIDKTNGPSVAEWWEAYRASKCQCASCQEVLGDAFWAGAFLMLRHLQEAAATAGGDVGPFVDAQERAFEARFTEQAAISAKHNVHH